jgi:hypothetical protein
VAQLKMDKYVVKITTGKCVKKRAFCEQICKDYSASFLVKQ